MELSDEIIYQLEELAKNKVKELTSFLEELYS
jgi:hypothetical protein